MLLMYIRMLGCKQETVEFLIEMQETEIEQRATSAEMMNSLENEHLGRRLLKRGVILHI